MPELPEVETARLKLFSFLKNRKILKVVAYLDPIVFDRDSTDAFAKALRGAKVVGSGRRGKYFWLELDRRPWPVFHFGMTGNFHFYSEKIETRPRFCKLELHAQGGQVAAMSDPRRFSRIRLAQDPLSEPPVRDLGFDPLFEFPPADQLFEILSKRRAPIKAVLLDQGLFAGVGNWIADEVLFQSGIAPMRLASNLGSGEVGRLRQKILHVIHKAVEVGADSARFPKSWLFHHRWGKDKNARTSKNLQVIHETIGGRTTAWVPEVQN